MTIQDLQRVELHTTQDDFAQRCASELNYRKLLTGVAAHPKTAEAMAACGIRPFDTAVVEKYKVQVSSSVNIVVNIIGLIAFCGFIVTTIVTAVLLFTSVLPFIVTAGVCTLLFFVTLVVCCNLHREWVVVDLDQYSGKPPPKYALETALHLKKELKTRHIEHVFQVHYLGYDPMLSVKIMNTTTIYLEIWDEPNFFQERKV